MCRYRGARMPGVSGGSLLVDQGCHRLGQRRDLHRPQARQPPQGLLRRAPAYVEHACTALLRFCTGGVCQPDLFVVGCLPAGMLMAAARVCNGFCSKYMLSRGVSAALPQHQKMLMQAAKHASRSLCLSPSRRASPERFRGKGVHPFIHRNTLLHHQLVSSTCTACS